MEEEGLPLRLVRCPKCDNLLHELVEYSIYRCGGCGAVLRGSNKSRRRRLDFGSIRSTPIGYHRTRSTFEKGRFGNLPYSTEGPSSSRLISFNSFGEPITKVQYLENNRVDLLEKLEELGTQIRRSCSVTESPNERLNGSYPWPRQHPHQQYLSPTYHDPFLGYNTNWQLIPPTIRPFSPFTSQETTYGPRKLPRHHLTHGGACMCFPISGGAPFISCCNCFELLKIPKKVTFLRKNDNNTIKCAVCSALILLRLKDNKIVASFSSTGIQQKVNRIKSNRSPHSSTDHDKCVYSFQLTHNEQNLASNEAEKGEEPSLPVPTLESQNDELTESQRTNQERVIVDNNNKKVANESCFAGLIKTRLKNKGKSVAFVNGQVLTNHAVKEAEKLAGPIHPEEYWLVLTFYVQRCSFLESKFKFK